MIFCFDASVLYFYRVLLSFLILVQRFQISSVSQSLQSSAKAENQWTSFQFPSFFLIFLLKIRLVLIIPVMLSAFSLLVHYIENSVVYTY